jgi:hypothetical protein
MRDIPEVSAALEVPDLREGANEYARQMRTAQQVAARKIDPAPQQKCATKRANVKVGAQLANLHRRVQDRAALLVFLRAVHRAAHFVPLESTGMVGQHQVAKSVQSTVHPETMDLLVCQTVCARLVILTQLMTRAVFRALRASSNLMQVARHVSAAPSDQKALPGPLLRISASAAVIMMVKSQAQPTQRVSAQRK